MLLTDGQALRDRTGLSLELRRVIVRDIKKPRALALPRAMLSTNPADAWTDPGTHIVVELAGGIDDARSMTLAALAAGRDVVTANKAMLASAGREILAAARAAGRCVAFEAAVAGGVPLIEAIRRGLIANRIDAVMGILNGTCNYILTRMLENDASYAHALAEAQRLGYAEADPALDVDGIDSAHKLCVLASLALRSACELDRIEVHGISSLELTDLTAGRELGYACKLLAIARRHDDGLDLSVQPTFIPLSHPLAAVGGPFNAVSVYARPLGHTMFYGRGAGGAATASAVLADIIDVALGNARRTFEAFAVLPDQVPPAVYRPAGQTVCPHYIRAQLLDRPGGIGRLATLLGSHGISIATIVQHEPPTARSDVGVPVVVTTHPAAQSTVRAALAGMRQLDVMVGAPVSIPVLVETD